VHLGDCCGSFRRELYCWYGERSDLSNGGGGVGWCLGCALIVDSCVPGSSLSWVLCLGCARWLSSSLVRYLTLRLEVAGW
jgi:hypothetical protein